jgi:hypothetical protein
MPGIVSLSHLRLRAILLPAVGVVALETAAQISEPAIGSTALRLVAVLALVCAIVAFSPAIFRVIEAKERTVVDLYKRAQVSAERLERLIESSGDAIITVDLDRRISTWSRGLRQSMAGTAWKRWGPFCLWCQRILLMTPRTSSANWSRAVDTIANFATERLRKDGQQLPVHSRHDWRGDRSSSK